MSAIFINVVHNSYLTPFRLRQIQEELQAMLPDTKTEAQRARLCEALTALQALDQECRKPVQTDN